MKTDRYWEWRKRDALLNRQIGIAERQLAGEYLRVGKELEDKIIRLFDEITIGKEDGSVLVSDLYRYNRYYDLMNDMNNRFNKLANKEFIVDQERFKDMYLSNSQLITDELNLVIPVEDNAVKNVLNRIWCQDGKHWSDRIWDNKAVLAERLKKGLVDCVVRGASHEEVVKTLMRVMDSGFNDADRIVRTELNYIQNQATYDRYADAGIKEYEYVAEMDDRTSEICENMNGKRFLLQDAVVGVNYPPLHPNCRSTVIAILEGGK